jgi:hypothetical protein
VLARRLLILLAVLMGLTALASGVAPREPETREEPRGAADPAAPSPASGRESLEVTVSASAGAQPRRIPVTIGQTVRLTVEGDVVDGVQLGELDIEPIEPASPALFELLAEEPGEVPITLVDAQRRIGVLDVRE